MTKQEAIDNIEFEHCGYCRAREGECKGCEYGIAIECIEKQIPRKPIVWNNGTKHCSVCDAELDLILNKRFCECGQAIDWGGDNE